MSVGLLEANPRQKGFVGFLLRGRAERIDTSSVSVFEILISVNSQSSG